MPRTIRHPEWRDANAPNNYPFEDQATLANSAGDTLLAETFLDAAFYPVGGRGRAYLSQVEITSSTATLWLGDEEEPQRASVEFDIHDPPDQLRFTDQYGRPAGLIVSEAIRLAVFQSWGVGRHEFTITQTPLVASVYAPTPQLGVRGVLLDDGTLLTGDVWLVGDAGVALSCQEVALDGDCDQPARSYRVIRVDVVGDPLFRRRLCAAPEFFQTTQFLQELCFVNPAISGTTGTETGAADIMLLTDTTGSMGGYIDLVKDVFPDVVQGVIDRLPVSSFRWAAADYKDYEDEGIYQTQGVQIGANFDPDPDVARAAINAWSAGGGDDRPEQNLSALKYIAENWEALGGRPLGEAPRCIIWGGDVPGWENGAKGWPYPTLQATLDALVAAEIKVFAVNMGAVETGLDEPGPGPSDGRRQGSTIASETGGQLTNDLTEASTAAVTQLLIDAIIATEGGQAGVVSEMVCCGPGDRGDIKITVGSQDAAATILRVRAVPQGLLIEAVGEQLEDIR